MLAKYADRSILDRSESRSAWGVIGEQQAVAPKPLRVTHHREPARHSGNNRRVLTA